MIAVRAEAPGAVSPAVVSIRPSRWWREALVVLTLSVAVGLTPVSPAAEQVGAWIAWPVAAAVLRELRPEAGPGRVLAGWLTFGGLSGLAWAWPDPVVAGSSDAVVASVPAIAALTVGLPLAVTGTPGALIRRAATALGGVGSLVAAFAPGPLRLLGWTMLGVASAVALVSLLRRRRALTGHELLRSSWLLLTLLVGGVALAMWLLGTRSVPAVAAGVAAAAVVAVPAVVSWLVAARQFRPVVAPVTVTLLLLLGVGLVSGAHVVAQQLLPTGSAGRFDAEGTHVAVTVLVAAALVPAGRAVYLNVLERIYGPGARPEGAHALTARLATHGLAPGARTDLVLDELAAAVAGALRLPGAAIVTGEAPESGNSSTVLPLDLPADSSAWLVLHHRRGREPLSPADHQTLARLSPSLALVVHATRLAADVERSRAAEAASREIERDRLRRDLHDGLGPLLSGLAMHARSLARHAPEQLREEAAVLATGLAEARGSLRRVVDGLAPRDTTTGPAALTELLESWRRAAATVDIVLHHEIGSVPDAVTEDVMAAAHFITGEAVANAVRHGQANRVFVRLYVDGSESPACAALVVDVSDDGVGLPEQPRSGVGLASMEARARALGGQLDIHAVPGTGTTVVARLPISGAP
ncbi:MAG TPA: ATP-binding protein [Actinomycetales bacterium]|nr:ATP-binding protein [Actinomycetales bacterium]